MLNRQKNHQTSINKGGCCTLFYIYIYKEREIYFSCVAAKFVYAVVVETMSTVGCFCTDLFSRRTARVHV